MVLTMPALVAAAVVAWQAVHRRSPLVRRWKPSSLPRRAAGPLSVRDSGPSSRPTDEVVIILHGLGTTGDYFGAFYDGLSADRRVVIADLLGFGHSLDENRKEFGVDAHVAALDQALEALDLDHADITIAAHSMSSAVALTWADRHRDRAISVYLWGPPIYPLGDAPESVSRQYGLMGRLFALDTRWAAWACRVNCANRNLSGLMMALMAPRWPTEVSRGASRHTWEAYHGSLRALVFDFDWTAVLPAAVPVTVFHGCDDPISDTEFIARLAPDAIVVNASDADHHVALQRPQLLIDALGASDSGPTSHERPPSSASS